MKEPKGGAGLAWQTKVYGTEVRVGNGVMPGVGEKRAGRMHPEQAHICILPCGIPFASLFTS